MSKVETPEIKCMKSESTNAYLKPKQTFQLLAVNYFRKKIPS